MHLILRHFEPNNIFYEIKQSVRIKIKNKNSANFKYIRFPWQNELNFIRYKSEPIDPEGLAFVWPI